MASQLETQLALNEAIASRSTLLRDQNELMRSQLGLVLAMRTAWTDVNSGIDEIVNIIQETQEALNGVSEEFTEAKATGTTMTDALTRGLGRAHTATKALHVTWDFFTQRFPKSGAAVMGFIDGIIEGFKFVTNTLTQVSKIAASVVKAIWDVGESIIAIPFKSLSALIEISNKLVPLMEAVARATEEVRKEFGDLSRTAGSTIIRTADDIGAKFEHLGLGGFAIFGSLDERIQAVSKLFASLGANVDNFSEEIISGNGAVLLFQKGLGLTDEMMGSLGKRAKAFGTTLTTQLKEMTKFAIGFSKKFGVSQKLISRDMGTMTSDVKNFGNLSAKELAKTSVYARKLGVDVKELLGVIEKFDTFESAAEGAAMLSQAFGAQADAIGLMKAENPAERIEELRKAFLSTGKSADMMSRQELKLLAQTTGLSEEVSRAVFSQKNFTKSLKDLEAEGVNVQDKTVSVEEAVTGLRDSIERMVKPFKQFIGFLQSFADGFARGFLGAESFRDLLTTVHNALRRTYEIGMKVGETFGEMFPGIKTLVSQIKQLFDVKSGTPFLTMINSISNAFKRFFEGIKSGPGAIKALFLELKSVFSNMLSSIDSDAFIKTGETLASSFGNIIAGLIEIVSEGALEVMSFLTAVLKGDKTLQNIPGGGIASAFIEPIKKAFSDPNGPVGKVVPAFIEMLKGLWEKYRKPIEDALKPVLTGIVAIIVGSAVVKAIGAVIITALSQALLGWITGAGAATITTGFAAVGGTIATALGSSLVVIPAMIAGAIAAPVAISKGVEKFNAHLSKEFTKTGALVGSAAAGFADLITLGLVPDSALEEFGTLVAKLTDTAISALRKLPFGEKITSLVASFVESSIEALSALGDMFQAIFSGDMDKIFETSTKFGEKLAGFAYDTVKMIGATLAGIMPLIAYSLYKGAKKTVDLLLTATFWVLEKIFAVISAAFGVMAGVFKKIAVSLKDVPVLGTVMGWISTFFEFFSWAAGSFKDFFKLANDLLSKFDFESFIKNIANSITNVFSTLWQELKTWPGRFIDFGSEIVDGLIKGLAKMGSKVSDIFKGALSSIKDVFSIKSPSKEMIEVGQFMIQGLEKGLKNMPSLFSAISFDSFDVLIEKFKSLDSIALKSFNTFSRNISDSPAVMAIKRMVEEVQAIEDTLDVLRAPLDIDAKLDMIGKELGLKDKEFKVERKNLQVNINLNVTIEADKMVKVLSEHGVVSTEKPTR